MQTVLVIINNGLTFSGQTSYLTLTCNLSKFDILLQAFVLLLGFGIGLYFKGSQL